MTLLMPWAIDTPAEVPVSAARALAFNVSGGEDGVGSPTSLKVVPLPVPGNGFRIGSGSATAVARAAAQEGEAYTFQNAGPADVTGLNAAPSGSARSDLVVARVEDPYAAGSQWQVPADPVKGPYVFPRVIEGVPAGTRKLQQLPGFEGHSAVTLARIDRAAGTGTINAANIVDLRELANGRQRRIVRPMTATGGTLESTGNVQWIAQVLELPIPVWASHMIGQVFLDGLIQQFGGVNTVHFIRMGGSNNSDVTAIDTDAASTDAQRVDGRIVYDFAIPAGARGTTQQLRVISRRVNTSAGRLRTGAATRITWDFQFEARIA